MVINFSFSYNLHWPAICKRFIYIAYKVWDKNKFCTKKKLFGILFAGFFKSWFKKSFCSLEGFRFKNNLTKAMPKLLEVREKHLMAG